ncbi:hypothetical protein GCM10010191_46160 [Actinomadura vinacea]|uniref:Leucine-binding protein domain-containing protein n=1 Tax=Actinomadura vinacea TaxID=115336 RepID=A0ABP5WIM5_9ACTN
MKYRIRRSVGTAVLVALSLTLAACGAFEREGGNVDEIRILVAAPLTGDSAETGRDMVNGARLAAQYLNEKGGIQAGPFKGKRIVFRKADDQLETEAATTIAAKFAGDGDLFALTGFVTSGQAQAAGVVLRRYELGAVVSFASADYLTAQSDNLVIVSASVSNFARVAADFAASVLGVRRVASIAGDFSFLDSYYGGLDDVFKRNGVASVSRQTYADGAAEYSTLLTRANNARPDVLMSGAFQADAGKMAAQMRAAGMTQPFVDFLGEGWGTTFSESAGSALGAGDYYQMDPADVFPEPGTLLAEMDRRFQRQHGVGVFAREASAAGGGTGDGAADRKVM